LFIQTETEMAQDKKRSLKLNIIASMAIQVLSLLTNLISKRAINYYLNVEYLGIQSIYSNFCDVLSFVFIGMGTAVLFHFYGPLARNDEKKIKAVYTYFDKIYRNISWVVLAGGFLSTFSVLFLVDADITVWEISVTYIVFMLSVVFYNRQLLRFYFIQADQRRYIVATVYGVVDFLALAVQVLLLHLFHSYLPFVICLLVKNLIINLIFKLYIKKNYSYIFDKNAEEGSLQPKEKKQIHSDVTDMAMFRFGNVLINNTDSIYISYFISTAVVGIFSNYQFVVMGIRSIVGALYEALRGKIGFNMQTTDKKEQFKEFNIHSLVNAWMVGVCICCFYYLIQDFIGIWMGKVERLPQYIVWVLIVNFYLEESRNATKVYRESAGLFQNIKKIILLKGFLNIILSFILGLYYGLMGILVATSISAAVTLFWYEPVIVYRYFKKSIWNEVLYNLYSVALTAVAFLLTGLAISPIQGSSIFMFFIKALVCFVTSNIIYLLLFAILRKTKGTKNGH